MILSVTDADLLHIGEISFNRRTGAASRNIYHNSSHAFKSRATAVTAQDNIDPTFNGFAKTSPL
jgi:hypothetical protein